MTNDTAVVARLVTIRQALEAMVWPTAVEAAASSDLVKLKVDIEAIDFALGHRPSGIPEGSRK